jgi:hypothetical protein
MTRFALWQETFPRTTLTRTFVSRPSTRNEPQRSAAYAAGGSGRPDGANTVTAMTASRAMSHGRVLLLDPVLTRAKDASLARARTGQRLSFRLTPCSSSKREPKWAMSQEKVEVVRRALVYSSHRSHL